MENLNSSLILSFKFNLLFWWILLTQAHMSCAWLACTLGVLVEVQITQGRKRTKREWQANRCLPLWLTQPKIILVIETEICSKKVPQIQAAGKLYGLKRGPDTGREARTGERNVLQSGAHAGKCSATWQAKQTNKSKVKSGEIRGKADILLR